MGRRRPECVVEMVLNLGSEGCGGGCDVGYGTRRGSATRVMKKWRRMSDATVVLAWTDGQGRDIERCIGGVPWRSIIPEQACATYRTES